MQESIFVNKQKNISTSTSGEQKLSAEKHLLK